MNVASMIVKGRVVAGTGDGKKFASLLWFKKQVKEILNFEPYPGTLNLSISEETSNFLEKIFGKNNGYIIVPEKGYFPALLYRALINFRVKGAVIKPCVPTYPKNILELVAPVYLRGFFNLKDGDEVYVKIYFE
ncbi:CTP-dependent riboflavin kinase [Candidatus Bathyarchaeota archaeon]|nr:CTP-dependent riboflavin kinase [Candidatus Bathyarchaeota archaeon]